MRDFLDLTAITDEPIDWLYEPWVESKAITVFLGEGGSRKSWLALDMAIAAAAGQPWLRQSTKKQRPVMVLDQDTGETITKRRILALCRGRSIHQSILKDSLFVLPRCGFRIDKREDLAWLLRECTARSVEYVIADALVAIHGGSENESQEMAKIMRGCVGEIISVAKAGAILIHHMSKPTKENFGNNLHRARGSGEIVNSSDCVIVFTKADSSTQMTLERSRSAAEEDWPRPTSFIVEKNQSGAAEIQVVDVTLEAQAITAIHKHHLSGLSKRECSKSLIGLGYSFSESTAGRALATIRKVAKLTSG